MNFRGKYGWMVSRKALRLFGQNPAATFIAPRAIGQWNHRVSKAASVGGGLEGERQKHEYPDKDNHCCDDNNQEKSSHSCQTPEWLICSIQLRGRL
jgi:hypothetical protein